MSDEGPITHEDESQERQHMFRHELVRWLALWRRHQRSWRSLL